MNNLKTSEKILLSLAALCVVAAAVYYFFIAPSSKKVATSENNQEISNPASPLKNNLVKDSEAIIDDHIKEKAETAWVKNPFWDRKSSAYQEWAVSQGAASGGTSSAKIIYSGYIDAGKVKIAIINGLEYRAGEQLEMEGYVLERVTPSQVLIVNKNSGSEVAVPIKE